MGLKTIRPLPLLKKQPRPIVILTAMPDKLAAEKLAFTLVEMKLAACVNIIPHMESIYFWENKLVKDQECKVFIKTSSAVEKAAIETIRKKHPYSVPEITVIGGKEGVSMHHDYWSWLTGYISAKPPL